MTVTLIYPADGTPVLTFEIDFISKISHTYVLIDGNFRGVSSDEIAGCFWASDRSILSLMIDFQVFIDGGHAIDYMHDYFEPLIYKYSGELLKLTIPFESGKTRILKGWIDRGNYDYRSDSISSAFGVFNFNVKEEVSYS